VFAGANSSGKSTIIQSILLMKQTVQYAPPTRALALNGPMLKLGKFSDVKNAASDQDFIGIGWEIELAESDKMLFRNALNTGFQPTGERDRTGGLGHV
jgi:AAA15 family ATPase/GTPase